MLESTDESAVPDIEGGPAEISAANIAHVERFVHVACDPGICQSYQILPRLSLALGIHETELTSKDPSQRRWPGNTMVCMHPSVLI